MTKNQHGFTMIEMLLAVAILAISVLAVASMVGIGMKGDVIANNISVGSMLAQQVAEELISRGKNESIWLGDSSGPYVFPGTLTSPTTFSVTGSGSYTATYAITIINRSSTNAPQVAQVVVTVNKANSSGTIASFTTFKNLTSGS